MKIQNIYIINLKRRKDKLKRMLKRINEIDPDGDINITIFEAIDGININSKYLEENNAGILETWKDPFKKSSITNGEIGCALSHCTIWEEIVKNNYNHSLIIEDDAVFSDDFINKTNTYDEPIDADLIYFGRKKLVETERKYCRNLIKPEFSYWTIGYYITYSGALKFIQSNFKMNLIPVDEFIPISFGKNHPNFQNSDIKDKYKLVPLVAYALEPMLIKPEEQAFMDSDVESSINTINENEKIKYKDYEIEILNLCHDTSTDGYLRFKESLNKFNLYPTNIGEKGSSKMKILNNYLNSSEKRDNVIVIVVNSEHSIITTNIDEIIEKFLKFGVKVLFGSKLMGSDEIKYTSDELFNYIETENIVGFYNDVCSILKNGTNDILSKLTDTKTLIGIDNNTNIFFNVYDTENIFKLDVMASRLMNGPKKTMPAIITLNGPERDKKKMFSIKEEMDMTERTNRVIYNNICNYIPLNYRATYGYNRSNDLKVGYNDKKILISVYIDSFNQKSLDSILNIKYNKLEFDLYIDNDELYNYIKNNPLNINIHGKINKTDYMISTMERVKKGGYDNVLCICDNPIIKDNKMIEELIKRNKNIIAPYMIHLNPTSGDTPNFNLMLAENKPSPDFQAIVNGDIRGCWNVPSIDSVILISNPYIMTHISKLSTYLNKGDSDNNLNIFDSFSSYNLNNNIFMYIDNLNLYGTL